MNEYSEDDLPARLDKADLIELHPLRMTARDIHGAAVPVYGLS